MRVDAFDRIEIPQSHQRAHPFAIFLDRLHADTHALWSLDRLQIGFRRDFAQRFLISRADDRSNQSFLNRHCDANIGVFVITNKLFLKRRIDFWVLYQRRCRHFDDYVVDADLQIGIECIDATAHLCSTVHLDLGGKKEVRHWSERGDQSFSDSLSYLAGWLIAIS